MLVYFMGTSCTVLMLVVAFILRLKSSRKHFEVVVLNTFCGIKSIWLAVKLEQIPSYRLSSIWKGSTSLKLSRRLIKTKI